jgi:hypothetical protein
VLKPRSTVFGGDGGRREQASIVAEDAKALERELPEFGLPFLLQRHEPGPLVSLAGVFADGRLRGRVFSRYRRTWPPHAGPVSCSETVEAPPALVDRTAALLIALGWQGIFELELIERGPESFGAIDFNPRLYGSLALAARAGVPLPALWCDWLLGREVEASEARAGLHYRWEDAELRNLARALRERRLRDLGSILRPHRGTAHAYFRWHDPGPLIARVIGGMRDRGSKRKRQREAS